MSDKGFFHNVLSFFTEPMPVLTQHELEMIHTLNQKLDNVSQRLGTATLAPSAAPIESPPASLEAKLDDLNEQVRKLAKTQFKANTLQESQQTHSQEALDNLKQSVSQREAQQAQAIDTARLAVLKELLPVMDSLDAAFETGKRQMTQLPLTAEVKKPIVAWLDGIRLARMRLLEVLASHEVKPIATVGEFFDPHRHVAVGVDTSQQAEEGRIVREERRGYATSTQVLREAEVVVAKGSYE